MNSPVKSLRPKGQGYKKQSKILLENTFPRISCAAINAVLKHVDFEFTDAFHILRGIQVAHENDDDANNAFPRMPSNIKVVLKGPRVKKKFRIQEASLLKEVQVIPALNETKENEPPRVVVEEATEAKAKEDDAALVECGCCYGDYPPEDMKECSANVGHAVCKGCIYRYVSEQLDGNNCINFQCIINDQCRHRYDQSSVLDQVLSPGLKRRTNDAIFRSAVEQAGVEGVWTCQQCAFIGFLDAPYATVDCPQCDKTYCTMCHRVSHGQKTCEEVKAEEEILKNPVHRAHEKMSAATIRRCPTCFVNYSKLDGCNKMTCKSPGCNTLSCYLCQVKIEGYSHFCNHKRTSEKPCPCGKTCELWTSTDKMIRLDREARRKAGRDVLEAAGFRPDKIELVLASPPGKKKAAPRVVPPAAPPAAVAPAAPAVAVAPALNPRQNDMAVQAVPQPVPPVAVVPANNNVPNPRQNAVPVQNVPRQIPPEAVVAPHNNALNQNQNGAPERQVLRRIPRAPEAPQAPRRAALVALRVAAAAQQQGAARAQRHPQPRPEMQEENGDDADDQAGQPQPEVQDENGDDWDDVFDQFHAHQGRRRERCIIL